MGKVNILLCTEYKVSERSTGKRTGEQQNVSFCELTQRFLFHWHTNTSLWRRWLAFWCESYVFLFMSTVCSYKCSGCCL